MTNLKNLCLTFQEARKIVYTHYLLYLAFREHVVLSLQTEASVGRLTEA